MTGSTYISRGMASVIARSSEYPISGSPVTTTGCKLSIIVDLEDIVIYFLTTPQVCKNNLFEKLICNCSSGHDIFDGYKEKFLRVEKTGKKRRENTFLH